jgi:uncharacterized membrane protein
LLFISFSLAKGKAMYYAVHGYTRLLEGLEQLVGEREENSRLRVYCHAGTAVGYCRRSLLSWVALSENVIAVFFELLHNIRQMCN